ncbi:MAG: DNA polymerase I [Ruminococcus sp.]
MGKAVLIDGHSIIHRAFYGIPDLTNKEGLHTNAVYGFLNIMFKVLEEEKPDYLTVAFDLSAPTFRHIQYDAYKGTRKPMPPELREQIPLLKEVLASMGILTVSKEGYEADDMLGTVARLAREKELDVTIVSGDRDLLQLAQEHVKIRIPKTKGGKTVTEDYYAADVMEKYQVTPLQFIEVKGLMGDASDNIPGIPGVGEKTATKLIKEYGSIENAHDHLEEIKPNKAREALREYYDQAMLSKDLATIRTDCPLEYDWESARVGDLFNGQAREMFLRLEFKNLLSRFFSETPVLAVEDYFFRTEELAGAEQVLEKAQKGENCGISLMTEGGRIFGVSAAFSEKDIYYLPVQGFVTEAYLKDWLSRLAKGCPTVSVMNLKSLLPVTEVSRDSRVFDVEIAAYLDNPLKSSYPYEDIAREYLNLVFPSRSELLGKATVEQAAESQEEGLMRMACFMSYTAFASREPLRKILREKEMEHLYEDVELPLVYVLYDMEKEGIQVKKEELAHYGDRLQVRIRELEAIIYQQAGETFNINSPKQLGVILFEKLGLPGGKKTKTGYSTAADVLEKLAPDHEIVSNILEYRQLAKLKSTYADGLANYIGEDGRIHSSFNQTITATGRISSTEPNLQNIPIRMELGRLIRKVFVPREGCVFLDADYSQIELRVLAHCSGDERLIQAYREERDIHRITASQVFHIPFDQVTDLQRRNAKAVNFGIVYGISSFGLSQDLSITRKEAADYIEKYFETYPGVKTFLDGLVSEAKEKGYARTLFGRRRPMPELSSGNFMQRSFGERVAMNAPIQGTAADIIKIAMIRVHDRLEKENLRSRLILQVHDELLVETWKEETEAVSAILKEEMMKAAELLVPLEVDMHQGESWYEAK